MDPTNLLCRHAFYHCFVNGSVVSFFLPSRHYRRCLIVVHGGCQTVCVKCTCRIRLHCAAKYQVRAIISQPHNTECCRPSSDVQNNDDTVSSWHDLSDPSDFSKTVGRIRVKTQSATLHQLERQYWRRALAIGDLDANGLLEYNEFKLLLQVSTFHKAYAYSL
jgi:hypothetical protein